MPYEFKRSSRLVAPYRSKAARAFLVASIASLGTPFAFGVQAAETFAFQGLIVPGAALTVPQAISADGSMVVGYTKNPLTAFRYAGGSFSDLGTPNGFTSEAAAVSGDGSVIVGDLSSHPFVYAGGTMHDLGFAGKATGVSADGTIVVGISSGQAFRYSGGIKTLLGFLPGGIDSGAYGISGDGNVIVGYSSGPGGTHAFRYAGGSMIDLGTLGDGTNNPGYSVAYAASFDGTVIVGYAGAPYDNDNPHPVIWNGTMITDLGSFGGDGGYARAVSSDGKVVVGESTAVANGPNIAFRWQADKGMQSITDLLTASGVDMAGWNLTTAAGKGWIVRCTNGCGILTIDNTTQSFAGLVALGATGSTYIASQFDGAGDMADAGKANPITGFASGAFDSDPTASASVGATYSFGDDLVAGATVGVAGIQT